MADLQRGTERSFSNMSVKILLKASPQDFSVLITGGCGYVGTHTVVRLLEENARVVVVDNLATLQVDPGSKQTAPRDSPQPDVRESSASCISTRPASLAFLTSARIIMTLLVCRTQGREARVLETGGRDFGETSRVL